jgi:hypothetical protein
MKIVFKPANENAPQVGQTKTMKSSEKFLIFKERFDGYAALNSPSAAFHVLTILRRTIVE